MELVRPVPPPDRGDRGEVRIRRVARSREHRALGNVDARDDEHAAVARLARRTPRDDLGVGRCEPRAGAGVRRSRGGSVRVDRRGTVRRRLRALPHVLPLGGRPLREHPEAVRHAPRGRAHRVRVPWRARVRIPHPLVPRRARRGQRLPRVAHRGAHRAPRVAAPDGERPRLRRRPRTRARQDRDVGRARDARADLRARARSDAVGTEERVRDRRRRRAGRRARGRAPRLDHPRSHRRRAPHRRRGALEPASLRPARRDQPRRRFLPAGAGRAHRLRAARGRRARLRRRARRRPPPGPHRPRSPRPVELARPARHHRRHGRDHRRRAPGRHRLRPRRVRAVRRGRSLRTGDRDGGLLDERRGPAALDGGTDPGAARATPRSPCGTARARRTSTCCRC